MANVGNTASPRQTAKWLLPAISVIVGLLPNFMPDKLKQSLIALLGVNYPIYWGGAFLLFAILFVIYSYRSTLSEASPVTTTPTVDFSKIRSKAGKISLKSSGKGDITVTEINSHSDSSLELKHKGNVKVSDIESGGDTIITNDGI